MPPPSAPPTSRSHRARWIIYFIAMALLIALMVLIYLVPALLPLAIAPVVLIVAIGALKRDIRDSRALARRLDSGGAYPAAVITPAQCSKCGYDCSRVDRLAPCPECGEKRKSAEGV